MLILCTMKNEKGIVENERGYWLQYARFALKYSMNTTAEYYLKKRYEAAVQEESQYGYPATQDRFILACFYVQQGQFRQAKLIIQQIINTDWKHLHANILLGLMYQKLGEPGLSRKHFAIAKVKRMRDLGLLAPKSSVPKNYRTQPLQEYKVEIIDFKNVTTKD